MHTEMSRRRSDRSKRGTTQPWPCKESTIFQKQQQIHTMFSPNSLLVKQHVRLCLENFCDWHASGCSPIITKIPKIIGRADEGCIVTLTGNTIMHDDTTKVVRWGRIIQREKRLERNAFGYLFLLKRHNAKNAPSLQVDAEDLVPLLQTCIL